MIVPLVATGMIGMLAYATGGPMRYHGLAWPPRFVMVWTVFVAACLFAAAFAQRPRFTSRATRLAVCVAVGLASVAAQHLVLKSRRDYDGAARIATVALRRSELASGALTMKEEAVLRCLGARLPRQHPGQGPGVSRRPVPSADAAGRLAGGATRGLRRVAPSAVANRRQLCRQGAHRDRHRSRWPRKNCGLRTNRD